MAGMRLPRSSSPLLLWALSMLQCWLESDCQWPISIGRTVSMPGNLEGGSFLYGTDSLAVQEVAQCPNCDGVTYSQDPILSGLRGPAWKPWPWLAGRGTPQGVGALAFLVWVGCWLLFAFFIIWLSFPSETSSGRGHFWDHQMEDSRVLERLTCKSCVPSVEWSLICMYTHSVCGQMKKLGREGLQSLVE